MAPASSYLSAVAGIMAAEAATGSPLDIQIGVAQFGIMASGLVSIVAGLVVKYVGKEAIDKVLPPTVTGSIAMVIGLTLASNALSDASSAVVVGAESWAWVISLTTLFATIAYSVYLKGFWKQISLLLGPLTGCLIAFIIGKAAGIDFFRVLPNAPTLCSRYRTSQCQSPTGPQF